MPSRPAALVDAGVPGGRGGLPLGTARPSEEVDLDELVRRLAQVGGQHRARPEGMMPIVSPAVMDPVGNRFLTWARALH